MCVKISRISESNGGANGGVDISRKVVGIMIKMIKLGRKTYLKEAHEFSHHRNGYSFANSRVGFMEILGNRPATSNMRVD